MVIEDRVLWLARSFGLSRYNHCARSLQNDSQIFLCFGVRNWSILLFSRIIINVIITKTISHLRQLIVNYQAHNIHANTLIIDTNFHLWKYKKEAEKLVLMGEKRGAMNGFVLSGAWKQLSFVPSSRPLLT